MDSTQTIFPIEVLQFSEQHHVARFSKSNQAIYLLLSGIDCVEPPCSCICATTYRCTGKWYSKDPCRKK